MGQIELNTVAEIQKAINELPPNMRKEVENLANILRVAIRKAPPVGLAMALVGAEIAAEE